jgi:hypothetical protein
MPRASPYSRAPSCHHLHSLPGQLTQGSRRPPQVRQLVCPEFKRPKHHLELTVDLESVRITIQMAGGIYWAGKVRVLANEPPDLQALDPVTASDERKQEQGRRHD